MDRRLLRLSTGTWAPNRQSSEIGFSVEAWAAVALRARFEEYHVEVFVSPRAMRASPARSMPARS